MTLRDVESRSSGASLAFYMRKLMRAAPRFLETDPSRREMTERYAIPVFALKLEEMLLGDSGLALDRPAAKTSVPCVLPKGDIFWDALATSVDATLDYRAFREMNEAAAAALAAEHGTPSGLAKLTACMARIDREHISQDPVGEVDADLAFHVALYEASHNSVLAKVMLALTEVLKSSIVANRARVCELPESRGLLRDQHRAIHDAIMRHDPLAAQEAATKHLQFSH
jgi:GntR family transcriptional repressor for pyruvate dehydrogenase complex